MSRKKNNVIILNGPSSSGKTSTLNRLQTVSEDIWLSFGVDTLWDGILHSSHFCYDIYKENYDKNKLLFGYKVEKQNDKILREQILFENGKKIMVHMSECINALAQSYNIVVGDVIYPYRSDPNYTISCYTNHLDLENNRVFLMGINCSDENLLKREKLRNSYQSNGITEDDKGEGRPEGLALQQKAIVHENKIYDLMLDSTNLSPDQLVQIIFNFIENHEPMALKKMQDLFHKNEVVKNTEVLHQM